MIDDDADVQMRADDPDVRLRSIARSGVESGLPPLTGAPEAIARAEKWRVDTLMAMDDVLTEMRSNASLTTESYTTAVTPPEQISGHQVAEARAALNDIRHQTDAAWWLTNGPLGAETLLKQAMDSRRQNPY